MSWITIESIAEKVAQASTEAKRTGRIRYVFFDGMFLHSSNLYARGYAAKCYPGGRIETKGPVGDQIKKWQETHQLENKHE